MGLPPTGGRAGGREEAAGPDQDQAGGVQRGAGHPPGVPGLQQVLHPQEPHRVLPAPAGLRGHCGLQRGTDPQRDGDGGTDYRPPVQLDGYWHHGGAALIQFGRP